MDKKKIVHCVDCQRDIADGVMDATEQCDYCIEAEQRRQEIAEDDLWNLEDYADRPQDTRPSF